MIDSLTDRRPRSTCSSCLPTTMYHLKTPRMLWFSRQTARCVISEPCLTARHALAIPHILDAVLEYAANDSNHGLLAWRLVCKIWDEAALRQLFSSTRFNRFTQALESYSTETYATGQRALLLNDIMRRRPQLLALVRTIDISYSSIPHASLSIIEMCTGLQCLQAIMACPDQLVGAPKTITRVALDVPKHGEQRAAWVSLLGSLPQLAKLDIFEVDRPETPEHLPPLLAAVQKTLITLWLRFIFSDDDHILRVMQAVAPYLGQLRYLNFQADAARSPQLLECLPPNLQRLSVFCTSALAKSIVRQLADPLFLPELISVPDVTVMHWTGHKRLTDAEVRTVMAALQKRKCIRDIHSAGFKLYDYTYLTDSDGE